MQARLISLFLFALTAAASSQDDAPEGMTKVEKDHTSLFRGPDMTFAEARESCPDDWVPSCCYHFRFQGTSGDVGEELQEILGEGVVSDDEPVGLMRMCGDVRSAPSSKDDNAWCSAHNKVCCAASEGKVQTYAFNGRKYDVCVPIEDEGDEEE